MFCLYVKYVCFVNFFPMCNLFGGDGIQEVSGSIPLISTKTPRTRVFSVFFFYFPNFLLDFGLWVTKTRPLVFLWFLKYSRGAIMARITMRKVQETKLSEVFTLYLASAAARGVKDKALKTRSSLGKCLYASHMAPWSRRWSRIQIAAAIAECENRSL